MLEPPSPSPVVRFGVFELDLRSGELRKSGVRLNLPEQPLQILTALLEKPGALVTRDELRRRLWAHDTFVDFEHGLNAAVKRLRDVLGDSADTPRFVETVPKRGYRFVAPVEGTEPPVSTRTSSAIPRPHQRWWWTAAATGLAIIAGLSVWSLRSNRADPALRLVQLTAMTGHAMWPTFSPDGRQVAFAWQPGGEGENNFDIYVKLVGLADVHRLTTDPANDSNPSWSPDGRQIAFVRQRPEGGAIYLVSPLGGGERRLSDSRAQEGSIAWSPDGRYVAATGGEQSGGGPSWRGIYLISVDRGEARLVTPPGVTCHTPAFSPDGRRLAYVACTTTCALDAVDLDGEFTPTAPPRTLKAHVSEWIWGIAWGHDGRSLVYGALDAGVESLWRLRMDVGTSSERIEIAGTNASWPAIAPSGEHLAFSRNLVADVPYRFEPGQPLRPLLASSLFEGQLDFSPDGRQIAYCGRSGEALEVWIAGADGATPRQLTHGPGRWQCSPHWSPDGRQIAFDSQGDDYQWHIWTIAADGGVPHQLTTDPANAPTWSRDGLSVYYSGIHRDLWRVRLVDGRTQRLTHDGAAFLAHESEDGKTLLYNGHGALLTMPVDGGPSRPIVPCVSGWAVSTAPRRIYYTPCPLRSDWGSSNLPLHLLNPSNGDDRILGTLERFSSISLSGLAVSPDGKFIVYDRMVREGHDLMLIENFR
jgi:Tol biopolymer transport system component/DNA-binding winged helix-turn-helix (wHTH) protein